MSSRKHLWFKARYLGWGWTPCSKEGWILTLGYIFAIFAFALTIDERSPPTEVGFTFFLPITILTVTFIRIAFLKGEKPRWRWMGKDVSPSRSKTLWLITIFATFAVLAGITISIVHQM